MFSNCEYGGDGVDPCEWHCVDYEVQSGVECVECGISVEYPDKVELVTANYGGDWRVYVTCLACVRIRDSLFYDFSFGTMWERLDERYGLLSHEEYDPVDEDWEWGGFDKVTKCPECEESELATVSAINLREHAWWWHCLKCGYRKDVDMNNTMEVDAWITVFEMQRKGEWLKKVKVVLSKSK